MTQRNKWNSEVDYILHRLRTIRELENYLRGNEDDGQDRHDKKREQKDENPTCEFGVVV